ncbi:glycine--tRNA ligase subunit beta [Piscinibacter terrae]|uniref:Glycine--tRNA ligase beta subunit n=1 Tax=Piscinibacter terrae TaxID=2496871 RepID=A0A3N7HPF4_9BURK|nr:glycine--tRNA ligase subunit beta [Albitalea terrae]RQP22996.1 glycine--tRNA ligase subunit beta [Albitalea terrae]
MTSKNLLVELFVEELPPKALKKLGEAFASTLADSLKAQGLAGASAAVTSFASPRRLAVHVADVASAAADKAVSQKLMPVSVGLTADGQATPALLKKLAAVGADASAVSSLKRQMDGKAEALFFDSMVKGATLAEGLQKAVDEAIAKLPIPKVMKYQLADGWTSVDFVRPAHGLVALHGADVVNVSTLGLKSGRSTQGHRFEAAKPVVELRDADHYASQLLDEGSVIASFADRRADIVRQLDAAAAKQGLKPIDDEALLDEVTALVERPNVLLCQFEKEFLDVPQECLILTMKANQKYFPLLNAKGKLTHQFLVVSNIRPADASRVIEGNERVVRPRLSDAKFFFDQDRKKTLESRVGGLAKVVYHNKLGSQGERVERVRAIARGIGQQLGGEALAAQADQAARLAKADLLTDMVGEFPELQGIMGAYYAKHDGLSDDIAFALEDHYKPRFAGDELPRNAVGIAVALADKLETLAGLFGIGQIPTGDKDPFALRRHALGLIRMLIERELNLPLAELVSQAFKAFPATHGQAQAELAFFLRERLVGYLREAGYSAQEVEAVVEARPALWAEFPKRLAAVRAFKALPESESLAAANKRVGNILKKSDAPVSDTVSAALLKEPAEQALHEALQAVAPKAEAAFARGDYTGSLQALAALKAPVDAFFDKVMVNAEDPALRANRLGLLAQLHAAMNKVADLSRLAS